MQEVSIFSVYPACLTSSPAPTHLIAHQALKPDNVYLNQVCWGRDTSKMMRPEWKNTGLIAANLLSCKPSYNYTILTATGEMEG